MTHRCTKIVATFGPASTAPETVRRLLSAGVNVARINLSHGHHEHYRRWVRLIRRTAKALHRPVAILYDLQGPKMRIGRLKGSGPVMLRRGDRLGITTTSVVGDEHLVSTTYTHLPQDVQRGDTILIDDGRIELEVDRIQRRRVDCIVRRGGALGEHKGINLPGVALSAPALTDKDLEDVRFATEEGADYLALSFVRSARDVEQLQHWLRRRHLRVPIIAKIERAEALERLDEIVTAADGVMVARGDLGVELSLARVPILQKTIIERANRAGKLVITATQMLETMIDKPIPTRAEATDIANAIFDHTDAVMLSGETAVGKYPVEAVKTMHDITTEAERSKYLEPPTPDARPATGPLVTEAVVQAAAHAARDPRVKAIMAFTMSGATAQALCKQRPNKPIYALTADVHVYRRMALYWGTIPVLTRVGHTTDRMIEYGERELLRLGYLKKGDLIVVVAGTTRLKGATNMMKFLNV